MKLFVISDTHGSIDKVLEVYEKLTHIDLIVHLGDVRRDVEKLSALLGRKIVSVKGNNDGGWAEEDFRLLETEYGTILLTHGHRYNVKSGLQRLLYHAEELECKAVMFGHTHVPMAEDCSGIYLVNPGSLSIPLDGTSGSYAIVNTSSEEINASIVYYNTLMKSNSNAPKPAGPKITGGYLKGLMNESDRF